MAEGQVWVSWQVSQGSTSKVEQKFTPSLLFTGARAGKAEAAVQFYTSLFEGSSIRGILRNGAGEGDVEGTVKHAQFSLGDPVFMATDSSHPHEFGFNEAISFFVHCNTQEEVDATWNALSGGGTPSRCGWLKDQFGVSWQVVPEVLGRLLKHPDPQMSKHVLAAMMKMNKIIIKDLEAA